MWLASWQGEGDPNKGEAAIGQRGENSPFHKHCIDYKSFEKYPIMIVFKRIIGRNKHMFSNIRILKKNKESSEQKDRNLRIKKKIRLDDPGSSGMY